MSALKPIIPGTRFGRLVVLARAPTANKNSRFSCRCDCGNEKVVYGQCLKSGTTKSCGCIIKEILSAKNLVHGQARAGKRSGSYRTWMSMHARCRYKPEYADVKICDAWTSFENFYVDMGDRPEGTTIDRIDGLGHYTKGNCKWSNVKEQARNRRSNVSLTFRGETKLLIEWSEFLKIPSDILTTRMGRGWSVSRALSTPIRIYGRQ